MLVQTVTNIDIARMEPGSEPAGFTASSARTGGGGVGEWRVIADPTATDRHVIAQVSEDPVDYRFPLAVYDPVSAANVDVVIRFKPVGGKIDQAGGAVVRLTTADDYYVARANALEDNVRFYRVTNGRREQLKGVDTKVTPNQWHTLGLRAQGDQFAVAFDGKLLFTVEDRTFAGPGRVALWTKADSVTSFDAITIRLLP